jgi:hypothetical protein
MPIPQETNDKMHRLLPICAFVVAFAPAPAHADSPFVFGPNEVAPKSIKPGAKWKEGNVRLPAWPKDKDLIEVRLDIPDSRFNYYIDRNSLSTGDDGVVRYTLIAESSGGARNLSYEGIRCTPRGAYRIYAYGEDRKFRPASGGDDWRVINLSGGDPLHHELWRHYLCVPRLFAPRAKRDQVRMLRSGRVPAIENDGFLTN